MRQRGPRTAPLHPLEPQRPMIRVCDRKIVIGVSYSLICLVMSTVAGQLQQPVVDCDPARLWQCRTAGPVPRHAPEI
jgi:hypothetical protein